MHLVCRRDSRVVIGALTKMLTINKRMGLKMEQVAPDLWLTRDLVVWLLEQLNGQAVLGRPSRKRPAYNCLDDQDQLLLELMHQKISASNGQLKPETAATLATGELKPAGSDKHDSAVRRLGRKYRRGYLVAAR
jgi:hypothetical protein